MEVSETEVSAMEVSDPKTSALAALLKSAETLPGNDLPWLNELRKQGRERFELLGLPTTKHEEWRFTNIKPVSQVEFKSSAPPTSAPASLLEGLGYCHADTPRIVLVDGHFCADLSKTDHLPESVEFLDLERALQTRPELCEEHLGRHASFADQALTALNTALFRTGAVLSIPRGVHVETPILILCITTEAAAETASHPRHLIIAGENSQATVIESYVGHGNQTYLNNPVTEIAVAQNGVLDHYKLQEEGPEAFHLSTVQIDQERDSVFSNQNLVFGSAIARNNLNAVLGGEGIGSTLNGLTLGRGTQLLDNHTFIDHANPHCNTWEIYKTILDDQARGVFNGRIMVAKHAQKTDAKQTNQNLLLSETATINTKPQLEIFADDVRCTHGATIGQLDEEAIFYLRSRGIREEAAKSILTYAFAGQILDEIKVEALRDHVEDVICSRLPMGSEVKGAL